MDGSGDDVLFEVSHDEVSDVDEGDHVAVVEGNVDAVDEVVVGGVVEDDGFDVSVHDISAGHWVGSESESGLRDRRGRSTVRFLCAASERGSDERDEEEYCEKTSDIHFAESKNGDEETRMI